MNHKYKKREKPKIKILQIIWDGTVGGAQNFLYSLLSELLKYEELQIEVCFAKQEGQIAEKIKKLGIRCHCLYMKNGFDLLNAFNLVKLVRQQRYDLVHSHSPQPLVRLMMALVKHRGSILTEHGSILDDIYGRHIPEIYYHCTMAKFIPFYIAVSESIKKGLMNRHKVPSRKIKIIPTALDLSNFSPKASSGINLRKKFQLPMNGPIIGMIGRLSPEKGIDHLIIATKYIQEKFPDCITLIVGDGKLKEELKDQVNNLKILKNVFFLGEQTHIADIISMLDVLVIPSVHEGLPLVALEGMAMCKPVVGYNVRGISDVIIHNQTGLLVEKRDPLLLAEKIIYLLNNKSFCSKLGESGREYVLNNFNIVRIAQEYREVYFSSLQISKGENKSNLLEESVL